MYVTTHFEKQLMYR